MTSRRWGSAAFALALAGVASAQDIAVSIDTAGLEWIPRRGELVVELDRRPQPEEGRIAILIGETDVTEIFDQRGERWRYRSEILPLPSGESEVVTFLVDPGGGWQELSRHPLRVLTRGGAERITVSPRADLAVKAQLAEGHRPEDAAPERSTFQEGTASLGLDVEVERSGWIFGERLELLGVTDQQEALRFGELGEDADKLDLSSYWLGVRKATTHGDVAVELGHVSWSGNRYLGSVANRGLLFSAPVGGAVSVSALAAAGSRIVGWSNPLGLRESRHRIYGFGATFEVLPSRPGGLRLTASALDGSVLPIGDFNRGEVTDAEESDGIGLDLSAATASQRLRVEASWARSSYTNPFDVLLSQGEDLVPVAEEERDARSAALEVDLLRDRAVGSQTMDLTLALRHEQVDPQFRSVAGFSQADVVNNGADLRGRVGAASFSISGSRMGDNLDDIPSILSTRTRRTAASLGLPLAQMLGGSAWPALSYSFDRTHQYGLAIPDNSGFSASHVPDQLSTAHTLGLDWSGERWQLSYRASLSDQDNRQPGREQADFESRNQGISVGFTPHSSFDFGVDLDLERAESLAAAQTDETLRYGAHFGLRLPGQVSFSGQWSQSTAEDDPATNRSDSELLDLTCNWDFGRARGNHGMNGQLFLRFSSQDFDTLDRLFGFDFERHNRTLNAGINLSLH